jgi:hypothetical protein
MSQDFADESDQIRSQTHLVFRISNFHDCWTNCPLPFRAKQNTTILVCQNRLQLISIEWPVLLLSTESGRVDGRLQIIFGHHDDVNVVVIILLHLFLGSESKSLTMAISLKRVARSLL